MYGCFCTCACQLPLWLVNSEVSRHLPVYDHTMISMEKVLSFLKGSLRALRNLLNIEFTSMPTVVFLYLVTRTLADGMEEFLIMPTAWYYIASLGQTHFFLGVTLAAYSVTALLFSPVFGRLNDRFQSSKALFVIAGFVKFFGNLLYSIPVNAYFPLFGRLICGIASASFGVLLSVVIKSTSDRNRAKSIILFEGLFFFGTALAPAIGSFLTFNLNIFGWKIGPGNSPSFILMIMHLSLITFSLFLPRNMAGSNASYEQTKFDSTSDDKNDPKYESEPKAEGPRKMFDHKIFCLYFIMYVAIFLYCVTGFYLPLLTVKLYYLQLIHVKLLFLNASLFVFVLLLSAYILSVYISERNLLLFSITLEFFPQVLLLYFALSWNDAADSVLGAYLLLPYACLGMPSIVFSMCCSLVSRVSDPNHTTFYQGLALAVSHLAVISSRLIAGLTFSKITMTFTCIGLIFAWMVQVIWFFVEYGNFDPDKENI